MHSEHIYIGSLRYGYELLTELTFWGQCAGEEVAIFEATYRVVTESELSSKQFDDAFRTILVSLSSHNKLYLHPLCAPCSGIWFGPTAQLPGGFSGESAY